MAYYAMHPIHIKSRVVRVLHATDYCPLVYSLFSSLCAIPVSTLLNFSEMRTAALVASTWLGLATTLLLSSLLQEMRTGFTIYKRADLDDPKGIDTFPGCRHILNHETGICTVVHSVKRSLVMIHIVGNHQIFK